MFVLSINYGKKTLRDGSMRVRFFVFFFFRVCAFFKCFFRLLHFVVSIKSLLVVSWYCFEYQQEPMSRSMQFLYSPVTAFSGIYF